MRNVTYDWISFNVLDGLCNSDRNFNSVCEDSEGVLKVGRAQ